MISAGLMLLIRVHVVSNKFTTSMFINNKWKVYDNYIPTSM